MKREGTFTGVDGTNLYYRVLRPVAEPKAAIIALHGLGDHSGGIQNLLEALATAGYAVYACDLRGHGQSSGTRAFIRTWDDFRSDLHQFRELVETSEPGLPLYVVGHSLGGAICADYCLSHGDAAAGLVMVSPAISYELTFSEKVLVALMGRLKPDYTVEQKGDMTLLTQDVEIGSRLASDTLRHNFVTPGLGRGLLKVLPRILGDVQNLAIPFFLQYGADDQITPPGKLRTFFTAVGSRDKQQIEYQDTRHRPFDDIHRQAFLADLVGWLHKHVAENSRNEAAQTTLVE